MQGAILPKLPEKSFTLQKNDPLANKIAEIVGDRAFKKFMDANMGNATPIYQAGDEIKKPFVFSTVNMLWSDEYKTLYSVDSLHLLNIMDKIVDAKVPGYIEFRKNAQGDGFTLYIQPTSEVWYYFELEGGTLSLLSSDEIFNQGAATKTVQLAGIDKVDAFTAKFKEIYGAKELPKIEKKEEKKPEEKKEEKKTEEKKEDGF